ncbi:MAG: DUF1489 family protein [Candidatus Puniceispirillales bacterium]|nr:DUF1489 domain-containing protein [Alphaproteobacteria bacterium]MBL6850896.1 DUF1489 domain-containing protein [Alphaproteobacteria bacterium]MDA0917222.1 DUF1489 family protein [Pseudomonadota bacterium]
MYYHLKKIAVGIETVERLKIRQEMIFRTYGRLFHSTRNMPKKREELIQSGSMFWIIKRYVLVRQKIINIIPVVREDGSKGCEIELDKNLTKVIPTKMKPFQGWRYYLEEEIPQDLNVNCNEDDEVPEQIRSELIKLGLY